MADDFKTLTGVSPLITNERLNESLTKWFGEDTTFTHWEYVGDTGKGDSYLSELIRIKIYGLNSNKESKHVQCVLKSIPKNVSRRLTFRSNEFFYNEISFYEKVLPELSKFRASKSANEPFDKCPKLIFSYVDGVHDVICLEDESIYDYGGAVRQEGIDYDHAKLSFKVLARFHAISFAMKDQKPDEFERIRKELLETYYHERLWDWYSKFWDRLRFIAIDAVEKEYPNSIYSEKVKEFAVPEIYKKMVDAATNTLDTGVISHGDCWTNNFLYKYVNSRPVDAKIIDFQLTRCASPVLDVSFFVYACTTRELRDKHYDELIDYYYDVLSQEIRSLGSDPDKIYPKSLFMEEIKKYSYFGLGFSFESTPFIVLAPEDAVSMEMESEEKLNIDDFWQVKPFKTKETRLREANNVVHCVDRGYI